MGVAVVYLDYLIWSGTLLKKAEEQKKSQHYLTWMTSFH